MAPPDIRTLQRTIGNAAVARLVALAREDGRGGDTGSGGNKPLVIHRQWSDADPTSYPAPSTSGVPPTPTGGWNASIQTVAVTVERIPLEGLKQGLQTEVDGKAKATSEGEAGKAIAVVPTTLKPNQAVEILLHLHGHNIGYREQAQKSKEKGMEQGTVRDVAADRIEQQIAAGGRNLIGILPQGTQMSGFGKFNADAYINEVWGMLTTMKKLPKGATRGAVVLSGHSGAAAPIVKMLTSKTLPAGLGELVLFDAIHAGQRGAVETFLTSQMAGDLKALRDLADPATNGGLDAAAVVAQQKTYLAGSFRFRGIFTPKYNPQKKDADGKPMWEDAAKKKPVYDTTKWEGYGVQYEPLQAFIKAWMDGHTKGLDAGVGAALRENYKVIPAGPGATHNTIMGANDNLQSALSALPGAAPAPQPKPPAPKTGQLESAAKGVSAGEAPAMREPAEGAVAGANRSDLRVERGVMPAGPSLEVASLERDVVSRAPLTEAEQWEQDWNDHPGTQGYFDEKGRPPGTPRQRYDVLCPMYKAHGIPRPMVYIAANITTAHFYGFSTPAHRALASALTAAEGTLKGKGYATAPVTSVWAFNARTTSEGTWSNHADGKAVDMDPDTNPRLIDKRERKVITAVTGTDVEQPAPGYEAMKRASDQFRADYNPPGLTRRITELKAAEDAEKTAGDALGTLRDSLKRQRDTLTSERGALRKELKAVPSGKRATAEDKAKAEELRKGILEKETALKQAQTDIKKNATDLKKKKKEIGEATKKRELVEKELKSYEATDKAISELEGAVGSLPSDIKGLDDQIVQSKKDEEDARNAKDAAGVKAQQRLRASFQKESRKKKAELKKKEKALEKKKKAREEDPLRKHAVTGFLNLPKDVVDALKGAGLKWGGDWGRAKDFMHFEV